MIYTQTLLNNQWLEYYKLSHGKHRILGRILSLPVCLLWDGFKYGVMLPSTLIADTPRYIEYKYIKLYYFKRNYKPYVLQRYILN